MKKRGQAAAFIIIGLVILVVVIGFLAVKQGFFSNLFKTQSEIRISAPEQVRPVQNYLDSCVNQVTKEAISLAALQGGYISIPEDKIPTTPFTPLGSSLEILPGSDFKTAVWFRERGNAIQETNIPTQNDIEQGISNYVAANFDKCVSNLTQFDNQGFETTANGIPTATVQLAEKTVSATVNFPINIKILDTNFTLSQHRAVVDSNLGVLYRMSKEILESENKGYFLENKTIDTLVAYDPEVPFSGSDLSCTEKVWFKDDVERKLKNILFENVAAMRIKGTNYKLQDDKYKYLEFDALKSSDKDVTINLMYIPSWPTSIDITPSEGNILRSDQIIKKAGGAVSAIASTFFCFNQHRFVYDIKYPILVMLRDPSGLTFQFATEVIIDNNEPRVNRLIPIDLPDTTSPICNYPQKQVTIFTGTIDPSEKLIPLSNVSLSFKCFPASCPLGTSQLNANGEPQLTVKVPLCSNGVIEGFKEGFKQVQKTYYSSNDPDAIPQTLVELEPIYHKQVQLIVIDKDTGKMRDPYSTEQISFQFASKDTTYQSTFIYPNEENSSTVDLLPGKYLINSYLLRNSSTYNITIPKQKIENCVDSSDFGILGLFKPGKTCSSVETDAMSFDTVMTGGATNLEHSFTRQDLSSDSPLKLYILSSNIPSNIQDLQKIQIEVDTNKDDPLFKEPEV